MSSFFNRPRPLHRCTAPRSKRTGFGVSSLGGKLYVYGMCWEWGTPCCSFPVRVAGGHNLLCCVCPSPPPPRVAGGKGPFLDLPQFVTCLSDVYMSPNDGLTWSLLAVAQYVALARVHSVVGEWAGVPFASMWLHGGVCV
jgi:hypothetical protein